MVFELAIPPINCGIDPGVLQFEIFITGTGPGKGAIFS